MENYILGISGIVVSIFLFWLGYRQTIGAKKERVRSANAEIRDILVKRIILESFDPKIEDLFRLLEGKSIEHQVQPDELMSVGQVMSVLFTDLLETDFISQKQRQAIINRITPLIHKLETEPEVDIQPQSMPGLLRSSRVVTMLVISATLFSSIASFYVSRFQGNLVPTQVVITAFGAGAITLLLTTTFLVLNKDRDTPSVSDNPESSSKYSGFEQEVLTAFQNLGLQVRFPNSPNEPFDLEVIQRDKRYLIEIKNWPRSVSLSVVKRVRSRLRFSLRNRKATEAIVITKEEINLPSSIVTDSHIHFLTLPQFKDFVMQK